MTSKLIVTLVSACVLFAGPAAAQDSGAGGGDMLAACKGDLDTLCKDAGEGRGPVKCLRENESKVSADCKSALAAHRAAREAVKTACKADRETLCKDAEGERGAGMKCLRENASKVSSDCSKALAALPARGPN
jgi:hypothetical protein